MINNLLLRLAGLSFQQVGIGAVIVGFLFYNSSFYDDGSKLDAQLVQLSAKLQTEQAKSVESERALKQVDEVQANIKALEEQFKIAADQLPNELTMSEILRSVDALASTSGVSIKDKEPQATLKQDFLELIPLRIRAEGKYAELTMLMYYIASTQRITRVKSFSFTAKQDKKDSLLSFEAIVTSYRFIADFDKDKNKDPKAAKSMEKPK